MAKDLPDFSIIGFGAFGSFWAKLLNHFGRVKVYSRSKHQGMKQVSFEEALQANFVFLCVPMRETEKMIVKISQILDEKAKPWPVIIDVCSVKVLPAKWLKSQLPKTCQYLPTHPMFGPQSAVFGTKGLQMVICPKDGQISSANLKQLKQIFNQLELNTVEMTAKEHDQQSAISLALVHFLGRALEQMKINEPKITTKGYDHLKILKDHVVNNTWELFLDMQKLNPYAKKVRKEFINKMDKVTQELEKNG